jgi:holliday junction DNA helicase RuvA
MIARLRGTLLERGADSVVIEAGGVGYRVRVSAPTLAELGAVGGTVELRTHMHLGEGVMDLYGFSGAAEQRAFELLLRVQNVGPRTALQILSAIPAAELGRLVAGGDRARLRAVPGVGPKTAERLIVELREAFSVEPPAESPAPAGMETEAAAALVGLGLKNVQAVDLVRRAAAGAPAPPTLEVLVREALRLMQAR